MLHLLSPKDPHCSSSEGPSQLQTDDRGGYSVRLQAVQSVSSQAEGASKLMKRLWWGQAWGPVPPCSRSLCGVLNFTDRQGDPRDERHPQGHIAGGQMWPSAPARRTDPSRSSAKEPALSVPVMAGRHAAPG